MNAPYALTWRDPMIDEAARLAALESYNVLDTENEPAFDYVVWVAANVCNTPMALVSFVDDHRQFFKARLGVDICEGPIEHSACQYVVREQKTVVINDLSKDDRTKHNPLIYGEPYMRFYAGTPIQNSAGAVLGTLCVLDFRPRSGLTEEQIKTLKVLAQHVLVMLELRKLTPLGPVIQNMQMTSSAEV